MFPPQMVIEKEAYEKLARFTIINALMPWLYSRSPRPVIVEPLEQKDEEDGMPEKFINKNDQYKKYVEFHFDFIET